MGHRWSSYDSQETQVKCVRRRVDADFSRRHVRTELQSPSAPVTGGGKVGQLVRTFSLNVNTLGG